MRVWDCRAERMSDKRDFAGRLRDAVMLYRTGAHDEARQICRHLATQFPEEPDAIVLLGNLEAQLGQMNKAVDCYRDALKLVPERGAVWNSLASVLEHQGELEDAAAAAQKAVACDSDDAKYSQRLGRILNGQARWPEGQSAFENVVRLEPNDATAWLHLGVALHGQGQFRRAARAYNRAIELNPGLADAHASIGKVMADAARYDDAEVAYRRALELEPGHQLSLSGLALLANLRGDFRQALDFIEPAVRDGSANPQLLVNYARLKQRFNEHHEAIEILTDLESTVSARAVSAEIRFCLADIHDDLGEYDRAFEYYSAGNQQRPANFDPAAQRHLVDSYIEFFSADRIAGLAHSTVTSAQPVFIVGMPRSGTSLVEQILASHPDVHAAGERTEIPVIGMSLARSIGSSRSYPASLLDASGEKMDELASRYLAAVGGSQPAARRITDKLPSNFLNLGLIQLLFPNARIIHCQRHPLDTGLSCFFQNFGGHGMSFSQNLEHIGVYYACYRRLMEHWGRVLSLSKLDFVYEDLVDDPGTGSRKLLEFLDLPWDDRCLEFHRHERIAHTASFAQVKRPIYTSSVNRYENYEKHLAPLKQSLEQEAV